MKAQHSRSWWARKEGRGTSLIVILLIPLRTPQSQAHSWLLSQMPEKRWYEVPSPLDVHAWLWLKQVSPRTKGARLVFQL